ncbi:helix-turn-helix domain-containing protein [Phycobium rhodophyticola]
MRAKLMDPRFDAMMIGQIALNCGFNDISYFNRSFARHYEMTPSAMRAAR